MKLDIRPKAQKSLFQYRKKDKNLFESLMKALRDLEKNDLQSSNIKSLSGLQDGYRKRVGRYRILFTVEYIKDSLMIWIVDIEKDTQKDYKQWTNYIKSQL